MRPILLEESCRIPIEQRILVTGGSGFLGDRLITRLLSIGVPVRAILRRPNTYPSRLPGQSLGTFLTHPPLYEECVGDFTDPVLAKHAVEGCSAVVHCAATGSRDFEVARHVNVRGTMILLEAARATGVRRFVQISSIAVYDRTHGSRIDENSPTSLRGDAYAITKAEADNFVLSSEGQGLSVLVLRPANILGLHPSSTWSVRMPLAIRFGRFHLNHDGEDSLVFVDVNDLVETILRALVAPEATGLAYNISDFHTTWRFYAETVRAWFDSPPIGHLPLEKLPVGSYWKGRYVSKRARTTFGHYPCHSFDFVLAETRDFWLSNGRKWVPWVSVGCQTPV